MTPGTVLWSITQQSAWKKKKTDCFLGPVMARLVLSVMDFAPASGQQHQADAQAGAVQGTRCPKDMSQPGRALKWLRAFY